MKYFDKLGKLIGQRWRSCNCDETYFPAIAVEAIRDLSPARHLTIWDIIKETITAPRLTHQVDLNSTFGDPPLTVYNGRGFLIDVLFWAEGIPSIHQHAFSGAFYVLHGSSLHCLWDFHMLERIEMRLLVGRVLFKGAEILNAGDLRPILPGKQMIHATFHLEHPSVTIVIRTSSEVEHQPQYSYLPPAIAFAQPNEIPLVKRQTQILHMLLMSGKRREFCESMRHACSTADAYSVFKFITSTFSAIEDYDLREVVLINARQRFPVLVGALEPVLDRVEAGNRILHARRSDNLGVELNFFLALLRNVPDRSVILKLIQQRYPNLQPVSAVRDWLGKLSNSGTIGIRFPDCWLVAIEGLMNGLTDAEILSSIVKSRLRGSVPSDEAEVSELTSALLNCWLLQPLLAGVIRGARGAPA